MSLFEGQFFQPTFYEESELMPNLYVWNGFVADGLTPWRPDFLIAVLLIDHYDVRWVNHNVIMLRMIFPWKTMYMIRLVSDSTTVINLSKNPK